MTKRKLLVDAGRLNAHFCQGLKLASADSDRVEVVLWDSLSKSTYDIFDEEQPHLFIGNAENMNQGLINCLEEYEPKTLLYHKDGKIDERLKTPFETFSHCHPSRLGKSTKHSIMKAANKATLKQYLNFDHLFHAEISYIGTYKPELDTYLMGLHKKTRIFGQGVWPYYENHLGTIQPDNAAKVYKNSLISPNFTPTAKGEISSRVFDILASDGFCISTPLAQDIFKEEEVPTFKDLSQYHKLIQKFTTNPKLTEAFAGKFIVEKEHTYHNRLDQILNIWSI